MPLVAVVDTQATAAGWVAVGDGAVKVVRLATAPTGEAKEAERAAMEVTEARVALAVR